MSTSFPQVNITSLNPRVQQQKCCCRESVSANESELSVGVRHGRPSITHSIENNSLSLFSPATVLLSTGSEETDPESTPWSSSCRKPWVSHLQQTNLPTLWALASQDTHTPHPPKSPLPLKSNTEQSPLSWDPYTQHNFLKHLVSSTPSASVSLTPIRLCTTHFTGRFGHLLRFSFS